MKKRIYIILMLLFSILGGKAFTQSEVFFLGHASGVGGRALSMGSAYLAVSDDYSAAFWNPAGLTQLRRMELFTSLSHSQYTNEASSLNISTTDQTTNTKLNSIGFAFPIPTYRGSLVFAIGYNRVKDFDTGFSFDWFNNTPNDSVQQTYTGIEEGGLSNWVFAGAMEITQNLSLGAAFNLWRGKDDYNWNFYEDDVLNLYYQNNVNQDQQITTNYTATNFKASALFKLGGLANFAATLATPITFDAKEKWSESYQRIEDADSPYADSSSSDSGYWDYGLKSPFTFAVGAALKFLPNVVASAEVEYTDWSQTRYTTEPPVGNKFRENLDFKQNFRATKTFRLGGEFTVPLINTQIRAGVIRQPSPLRAASSKEDRNYITLGGGILLDKQVKFDFAWVRGWWKNDAFYLSDDLPDVTEKINIDKFFATMSIRF